MSKKTDFYGEFAEHIAFYCEGCDHNFTASEDTDECIRCKSNAIGEILTARVCSNCGKIINEGYVVNNGEGYYCSDECAEKHFSKEKWLCMLEGTETEDGEAYAYWTEWW